MKGDKEARKIEKIQKKIAILFNHELPVHLTTKNGDWINGYIKNYYGDSFVVYDRYDGDTFIEFKDILKITQFTGDLNKLKKWKT